ncbi:MAG TPA: NAD(P)/FAD-dependent oxidoreductase [Anaerolineales bacterium]|nr:NAD(P)/FAD-dependent oxidoreductase [Anaerolineales bacterium]
MDNASTSQHNILVLGGGPSGLSTALHLAKHFPHLTDRILILEKEHYPRQKLCAGGLVADAEIILQRLGLDVSEVPHVDAATAHFDFAGKGLTLSMPRTHTIRVIRRDEFDAWLAEKARSRGIEIKEGVTIKNIKPREEDVIVETNQGTLTAQVVVGADGSNGVTRHCVLPNARVNTARVLEVLTPSDPLRPVGTSPKRSAFGGGREKVAFFDFSPVPDNIAGYVWDFPTQIKGQPRRCWGIYDTNLLASESRPALRQLLAQEMARQGFDSDEYEIKGHPIRWFSPRTLMSVPRVLLVGDAAGADAIFGEGISMALAYGALAAREIGEAFGRGEFSFRGYRARVLFSPLGQTLMARWFIAHVIYPLKWRWFQILLWRGLKPFVVAGAWIFVLNWGKRLHEAK